MGLFDRSLLLANPQAWEKLVDPGLVSNVLTDLLRHLPKVCDISYSLFLTMTSEHTSQKHGALLRLF